MAYLALYREFRPKNFDEVIGQEHIVETLKNQIKNNKISHAYLFCGTRGTGKTSCAKILAKAVNCMSPINGSPCGECEVCRSIQTNGNFDIIEIDAASNNGVDQIRDLREKVNFLPNIGKYKVYIIDEVHMLTESAFNALLKTLEEPPEHVVFILATTEPEKIPSTILSRCLRFDFKLVETAILVEHLQKIFENKCIKYEPDALKLIAKAGRGSVRDTLSVAEMCKSYDEQLTIKTVEQCLGYTNDDTVGTICEAVFNKNGEAVIKKVEEIYSAGKNLAVLLNEICEFFKNVLITKIAPNFDLGETAENIEKFKQLAQLKDEKYILNVLKKLSFSASEIKFCDDQKAFLITALFDLFYDINDEITELKQRLNKLESMVADGGNCDKTSQNLPKMQQKDENFNKTNNNLDCSPEGIEPKNDNNPKEIFGELIKFVRQKNEIILLQCFGDVVDVKLTNDKFIFVCDSQDTKNQIKTRSEIVLNFLRERYNISVIDFEVLLNKRSDDMEKLKEMLDGKLKIE